MSGCGGPIVQEAHETHPKLVAACREHIFDHAEHVADLFATAKADRAPEVAARRLDFVIDHVERLLPPHPESAP